MSETMAADGGTVGLETNEIPVSDNVGGKIEPVAKAEPKVKPTTRDSVRDAIRAAEAKPADEKPEIEETEAQKAERLRNEKGQFTKAETPEIKTDLPAAKIEEKPQKTHIEPPAHWMGEDKIGWRNVPQSVRQTIMNDYKAMGEAKQQLESIERVLTPQRRQQLAQSYGSDIGGLDQILQTVEYSNRDPKGFIKWFADQFRIPLNEVTQGHPQVDPQAQQLQQYLQPMLEPVLSKVSAFDKFMQEQATQKEQAMLGVVNSFMNDSTNFPYAKDVEGDVLTLLGRYTGTPEQRLKAAYDAAVWSNPAIRARMLAEQTQTQQRQQSQVADQKRSMAASVTGAPGTAKPVANGAYVKENPRDTVRRTLDQLGRV